LDFVLSAAQADEAAGPSPASRVSGRVQSADTLITASL
jgi:hypothetical protein